MVCSNIELKMFAVKSLLILSVGIFFTNGLPLSCLKKAIHDGVPSLGIPPHDPLLIPHNFSLSLPLLNKLFSLKLYTLTWGNISTFDILMNKQTNGADEPTVRYEYLWYWDKIIIGFDFDAKYILQRKGHADVTFKNVYWTGNFNSTKDHVTADGIGRLNDVHVSQNWSDISVTVKGVDPFVKGTVQNLIQGIFELAFYAVNQFNILGVTLIAPVNRMWFHNSTNRDMLTEYCKNFNFSDSLEDSWLI